MRPELVSLLSRLYPQKDAQGFSWGVAYSTENPKAHLGKPTDTHSRYQPATFGPDDNRSGSLTNVGLYEKLLSYVPAAKSSLASARNNLTGLQNGIVATWDQVVTTFNAGQMLVPFMIETQNIDPQTLDHSYLVLAEVSTGTITGINHMLRHVFNQNIQLLDRPVDDKAIEHMRQVMTHNNGTPMANKLKSSDEGEPTRRVCPAPWTMVEGIMNVARFGMQQSPHSDLFSQTLGQDSQQWGQFKAYVRDFHRERLVSLYGTKAVTKREQHAHM